MSIATSVSKSFLVSLLLMSSILLADTTSTKQYYIATNVMSPLAGLNKANAAANALTPLLSNLEYGWTTVGGLQQGVHRWEARVAFGSSNAYNWIPMAQLHYMFRPLEAWKKNGSHLYTGLGLRYWDYYNTETDVHRHNVAPAFTLGRTWEKGHLWMDLRLQQDFAVYSSSSLKNAQAGFAWTLSSMPGLSPILPAFSFDVGYLF